MVELKIYANKYNAYLIRMYVNKQAVIIEQQKSTNIQVDDALTLMLVGLAACQVDLLETVCWRQRL